jgi:pyruvate dehydrogenase E2 component (dihydrolipoamide acetyltransferase)
MAGESITIKMPQMGESLTEGTIGKWLKKVGDNVKENEDLVEILTDKMNTAIPSEVTGVVAEIIAQEGDVVQINQPIAVIKVGESSGKAEAVHADPDPANPIPAKAEPAPEPTKSESVDKLPSESKSNGTDTSHTGLYPSDPSNLITLPSAKVKTASETSTADQEHEWRERSSPLVRRILEENNLPLSILDSITGSGSNGRITKDDVLEFVKAGATQVAAPTVKPAPFVVPTGVPSWLTPPNDTDADVQPLAGIRKIIAERLSYSEQVAPHVTTFAEVDVTDLVALRSRQKQYVSETFGANLTFLPFVIKAVCLGLKAFPGINASLIGDTLYSHKKIHVGIAVSLDQTGLMLPVIKNADTLSIVDLAKAVSDLASRARSNSLKPDEIRGSTFTISNPGAFGGWISTPIINQPNAAILNTGTIKKMAWVMPDDSIVPRSIMFLSLSYDHRIVDGETSVKFLQHVKSTLENIERSFLG